MTINVKKAMPTAVESATIKNEDLSWWRFIPKKPPMTAPAARHIDTSVKIVSAVMSRFLARSSFMAKRSSALSIRSLRSSSRVCTASVSCRYDSSNSSTSSCCVRSSGEMGGSKSRGRSLKRLRRIMHMSSSSSNNVVSASAVSRARASKWETPFFTCRSRSRFSSGRAGAADSLLCIMRIDASAGPSTASQASSSRSVHVWSTASSARSSNGCRK
mmetsp:Transcript_1232/g.3436  ORF Transcript_1232/g.3436 Transcript_1232/m.3436 type:complete len:216 (+) Transcript_1232:77-724(+)